MKNNKKISLFLVSFLFFAFTFIVSANQATAIIDCEYGGTCKDSCYSPEEYTYSAGTQCMTNYPERVFVCCVPLVCTSNGSDYQCSTSTPSGYEAYTDGDNECKAKLGTSGKCYKKSQNTKCDDEGGTCKSAYKCTQDGGEPYDLGAAQCSPDICCIDKVLDAECKAAGGTVGCLSSSECKTVVSQTEHYDCPIDTVCCKEKKGGGGGCVAAGGTAGCLSSSECKTVLSQTELYDCPIDTVCCKEKKGGGGGGGAGIVIPEDTGLPDPSGGILAIIANLLDWLLTLFLILALIAFVITGVQYVLAMGNSRSDTLESAKNNFKYAIIAVVIVGAGLIILRAIDNFLSASPII